MLIAAIIAEYNPFHNGHAYHISETRAAGATHIVAIMSGNFTQRGTPAVAEKRARVRAALLGGVDLIIELPVAYAMASAQRFALGAISIAEGMGCVDLLSFGSESGYLALIGAAATAVDTPEVRARMTEHLATGMTFARARHSAVAELCGDEVGDMLSSPNDALAVEYIRQLRLGSSAIQPFAVHRIGARHDAACPNGELASASFLRGLARVGSFDATAGLMPSPCLDAMRQAAADGDAPFDDKKLESMMLGVLRRMKPEELLRLPDLSEGLENRIYAAIRQAANVQEIYSLAKSKRYTAARIRRVVMSAFLGLDASLSAHGAPYLRVLGFGPKGREVLARMKETATLPVSNSPAYLRRLGSEAAAMVDAESTATDLYVLGLARMRPCGYDFTAESVRL